MSLRSTRHRARRPVAPFVLGLALLSAVAAGCQRRGDRIDAGALPPAPFAVDASLLGPAQTDTALGIVFRPPSVFRPGEPDNVRRIQDLVRAEAKSGDPLAHDPRWIYGIPANVGMFKVARFLEPPPGGMNEAWLARLTERMREQVAPATLTVDRFRIGKKIPAARLVARNNSIVLVRVICQAPHREPAMIDIFVSAPDYPAFERAVESSIGSIAPL